MGPMRGQRAKAGPPPSTPALAAPPVGPRLGVDETELLLQLRAMLADLGGYVEREAQDLAAPMVRDAEARARLAVVEARGEVERQQDLVAELRRRLQALERQRERAEEARGRLAVAAGVDKSTPWLSLVAAIEAALAACPGAAEAGDR